MIISIHTEKAFVTNTTSSHDQNPQQIEDTCVHHFSYVWLFVTIWTVAHQAPLSMGFSSQKHWSGLPGSIPRDLTNPAIKSMSLLSPSLAGRFFFFFFLPLAPPGKPIEETYPNIKQVVIVTPQLTLYSVIQDRKLFLRYWKQDKCVHFCNSYSV